MQALDPGGVISYTHMFALACNALVYLFVFMLICAFGLLLDKHKE